jgi:hypothetical protein
MDKSSPQLLSRRRVFAGAGAAGALAAVAVAVPLAPGDAVNAAGAELAPKDDAQGRYQLSAHVQRYYQTAKV